MNLLEAAVIGEAIAGLLVVAMLGALLLLA